jgi:hypothetical protein
MSADFQLFAMHPIKAPSAVRAAIVAAETFTWRGRETVAIASGHSIWMGWRHDSSGMLYHSEGYVPS